MQAASIKCTGLFWIFRITNALTLMHATQDESFKYTGLLLFHSDGSPITIDVCYIQCEDIDLSAMCIHIFPLHLPQQF